MTNLETTNAVKMALLNGFTITQLAEDIGITRQTFYRRLVEHNWKKSEKALLANLLKVRA